VRESRRAAPSARSTLLGTVAGWALLLAGGAAAAGEPVAADRNPAIWMRIAKPEGSPIELQWKAKTIRNEGWFRVYRGYDLLSMELVSERDATGGVTEYRFKDAAPSGDDFVYQLRYAGANDKEVVLGMLLVERTQLQPAQSGPASWSKTLLAPIAAVLVDPVAAPSKWQVLPRTHQFLVQPPVPPPRQISV